MGPGLASNRHAIVDFWEFIWQQGGEWMWLYMEGGTDDMDWIAMALSSGLLVMVTDGLYNCSLDLKISSTGWMIACTSTKKMLGGWFYK